MALQLRPKARILTNPSLIHLFSTSSKSNISDPNDSNDESKSLPSLSSHFTDMKDKIRQKEEQQQQPRSRKSSNPPFSKSAFEKSLKTLSEICLRVENEKKNSVPEFFSLLKNSSKLKSQDFHPDDMSSSEKVKMELAKAREEFKMSESDRGSSRVQEHGEYDDGPEVDAKEVTGRSPDG